VSIKSVTPIQIWTHSGNDAHATLTGGGDTLAEEVPAIEKLSMTVELHLRGIEGEDAGHADKNDVRSRRMPVVCPFFNVHHDGIVFGHVALTDPANLLLPGQGGRIERSQPCWQRNEVRSRAAESCVRDRFH